MKTAIFAIQIASALLFSLSVLLQTRGTGLSITFGGTGNFYHEKRGAEKILAISSIVFVVIFLGSSFAINFVH